MRILRTIFCGMMIFLALAGAVFAQTEKFLDGFKAPENLTFDGKGNLYVSDMDHLWRVKLADASKGASALEAVYTRDPKADSVSLGGVRMGPKGKIYFSVGNKIMVFDPKDNSIAKVVEGFEFANGICLDDRGNLFIADSNAKILYVVPSGTKELRILKDQAGWVNGLVYSRRDNTLYFTISAPGRVGGYRLSEDGLQIKEEITIVKFTFGGLDDLTMDEKGNFYVCLWLNGKLIKVSPDGKKETLIEKIDGPSAIAFGLGPDANSLYILVKGGDTKFKGTEVVRLKVAEKGYRLPFLP